jgi:hypothetical protein
MTKLTDAEVARNEYRTYVETAYKLPSMVADNLYRHDRRRRKQSTTHEYTPEGEEAGTYVTTPEEDAKKKKNGGDKPEEALSDGDCYKSYNDYVTTAWKQGKR